MLFAYVVHVSKSISFAHTALILGPGTPLATEAEIAPNDNPPGPQKSSANLKVLFL